MSSRRGASGPGTATSQKPRSTCERAAVCWVQATKLASDSRAGRITASIRALSHRLVRRDNPAPPPRDDGRCADELAASRGSNDAGADELGELVRREAEPVVIHRLVVGAAAPPEPADLPAVLLPDGRRRR